MKDMTAITSETLNKALEHEVRANTGRAKNLRNAIARKKLEALREERELRQWLADVWSEPDDEALTVHADRRDEIVHSTLAA